MLIIVKNAAMNMEMCLSDILISFPADIYPATQMLIVRANTNASSTFKFQGTFIILSIMVLCLQRNIYSRPLGIFPLWPYKPTL